MNEAVSLADESVLARSPDRDPADTGCEARVVGFGDEDAAETGVCAGLGTVAVRQPVEPFQTEGEAAALAVEFDAQGFVRPVA
ncbi:hypothetical protein AQJ11_13070 [Streptomyces corchorusii]|uniref:Uncharacterized protein n=1 Tax=Streptomyces corchorusii TaxID=1903 RepID=A0A101QEF9_STRCK|nr:hypothetical protein AQJ11_13070 [Streptomyces corchorusii]